MVKKKEQYYWKRIFSPRGTVILEFALLTPVMLMIGMFVIEILQYYDAAIMADHTAWRIARIASVRTDQKGKVSLPEWKKYKADKFAAVLLMCTVTTGWGAEGKLIADSIGGALKSDKSKKSKSDLNTGSVIIDGILNGLGIVDKIEGWIDRTIGGNMWGRYPVQMSKTFSRLMEKDVLKVETKKIGELSYPVISTKKDEEPKIAAGYMVTVTLDFPMRGGWMYRYFSLDGKQQLDTRPAVHGRAMMLAEAIIKDPEKIYDADPKSRPDVFSVAFNLIKKLISFSKIKKDGEEKELKKARELRNKAAKLESDINAKKNTLGKKNAQLEKLRNAIAASQLSLDELENNKKTLEGKRSQLEEALRKNRNDSALKTELNNVKKSLKDVQQKINKEKDVIKAKNWEIRKPMWEAERLDRDIRSKEKELTRMKAKSEEYTKKYNEQQKNIEQQKKKAEKE